MNLTLVRDKAIDKAPAAEKLNYAVAQNDELFANLLTEKFIEAVSKFLQGGGFEALAEVQLVVDALTELYKKDYGPIYEKSVEELGKYTKRLMTVQMQNPADTLSAGAQDANASKAD